LRALFGIAQAFIVPSIYSIIIINYSDKSDDILGLASVCNALGVIIGPVFGSGLFIFKSYKGVYYGLSIVFALWGLIFLIAIPNGLNKNEKKDQRVRFDSRYSF